MQYYSLFIFFLSLAAFACVGILFLAWSRRQAPGAKIFFFMMVGVLEWTMAYSFQLSSNNLAGKLLWLELKYIGISIVPSAWLAFTLQYTGRSRWLTPLNICLLCVLPVLTLAQVWTNTTHSLFFTSIELKPVQTGALLLIKYGPGFWVHVGYSYLLLIASSFLLIKEVAHTTGRQRQQSLTILAASFMPWAGNVIWIFRLMPSPHLDYTAFTFTLSGLLIIWSFFQLRLLDIIPVARGTLTARLVDSMLILDRQDRIVEVNPSAERLVERPSRDLILQPVALALPDWPELIDALLSERQGTLEIEKGPAEQKRCFDLSTTPLYSRRGRFVGRLALLHEITQQKKIEEDLRTYKDKLEDLVEERTAELKREISERSRLEKEKLEIERNLRQAEKLEAIGSLAGGIAHDFNNILTAILGFAELSLNQATRGTQQRYNLELIVQSGIRAKELVEQIIAFTRHSEQNRVPVMLHLIIQEVYTLIRAVLPRTIEIRKNLQTGEDRILADPVQIHQVLMNLCTNAAHAMREKGGVLEITLSRGEHSPETPLHGRQPNPGSPIQLLVSDTGHGMAPELMKHIFDPFFTTKGPGEGSGLGLSVVRDIVKSHDGEITVSSSPGMGTTFHVTFPLFEGEGFAEAEDAAFPPRGEGSILYVDDEETITQMGKQMLTSLGYEVWTETSGHGALQAFQKHPERFDLVIADMIMPKMTGMELAGEILSVRPEIPVILCSGFHKSIDEEKALALGVSRLLMKPILFRDLAESVRTALDRGKRTQT